MGTYYRAVFGIGVKLNSVDECDEDIQEYLENLTKGTDYFYDRSGDECSGKGDHYLFINSPFKDGYDITNKVEEFKKWLDDNKITHKNKINVVGQLNIW